MSAFMLAGFAIMMTGGAGMVNQSTPDKIVEGTGMTIAQLSGTLTAIGMTLIFIGLLMIPLFLIIPMNWEISIPRIKIEW